MLKLIRSQVTSDFLTKDGLWTDDVKKADSFDDVFSAQEAKRRLQLENVEFYYLFEEAPNPRYDFSVPLP